MKSESIIAGIIGLCGVLLLTALLLASEITEGVFAWLLCVLAFICLVLHGFSRLRELDLRNLRLTLDRIEKVKSEIEEMYGGIEHIRRSSYAVPKEKLEQLGRGCTHSAPGADMRYTIGCILRERERLAKIFVSEKLPEKIAQSILDGSMNDLVFKWVGPEVPLDAPPRSAAEREREKREASAGKENG